MRSESRDETDSWRLARTLALPAETHRLLQSVKSPERDVKIWRAHLDAALTSEIEEFRGLLEAEEHERANKFHLERDRTRFIVARGLLRHLLSRGLECSTVSFKYGMNGKPALARDAGLKFNLSHSGDRALFALTWEREVGIDLESAESSLRDSADLPAMAERIFSKCELAAWRARSVEEANATTFLRAWTRKEACLKAAGLNLDGMAEVEVGFGIGEPLEITISGSPRESRRYIVHDLSVPDPLIGAIALEVK